MAEAAENLFPNDHNNPPEATPQQEWLNAFLAKLQPMRDQLAKRLAPLANAHAKDDQAAHQCAETAKALIAAERALKDFATHECAAWDAAIRAAKAAANDEAAKAAAGKAKVLRPLTDYLAALPDNAQKFTTANGVRAFLKGGAPSVEIADPDLIPPDLWAPDMGAIKAAIAAGREVPGVTIDDSSSKKAQVS